MLSFLSVQARVSLSALTLCNGGQAVRIPEYTVGAHYASHHAVVLACGTETPLNRIRDDVVPFDMRITPVWVKHCLSQLDR
ncbi:hypothetical protein GCM10025762_46870 [Haloechinothrix salitolerans]